MARAPLTRAPRRTPARLLLLALLLPAAPPGSIIAQDRPIYQAISWSRDGTKLALTARLGGGYQVTLVGLDRGRPEPLLDEPSSSMYAAWSPDGSRIAFSSDRDGNPDIYLAADGGDLTRLTAHAAADLYPTWSPDGSRIAFFSDRNGNWQLYVMNADGSDLRQLTSHVGNDYNPAWSPVADRIAFESARGAERLRAIYVIDADGSNETRLTSGRTNDLFPSWSPDGSQILYCTVRIRRATLAVMFRDGSSQRTLETGCSPSWGPRGARIAFVGDGGTAVYVMNLDGRGRTRVTGR
ncbi:MAG: PD40 domain-containing protein [Gemmatimonadetes bacterium]|nr:PD40 domain-containing protein [Gemmatimonadota bacterium]